jgi:hypothetical protein
MDERTLRMAVDCVAETRMGRAKRTKRSVAATGVGARSQGPRLSGGVVGDCPYRLLMTSRWRQRGPWAAHSLAVYSTTVWTPLRLMDREINGGEGG